LREEPVSIGTVLELWRYPVKSMAGEQLERVEAGPQGLWGDRGWAVRNEITGEIHNAKRFPRLMQCAAVYRDAPRPGYIPHVDVTFPDGTVLSSDSPEISAYLSDLMGRRVALHPLRPANDRAFYRRRGAGAAMAGALARYRPVRRLLGWAARRGLDGGGTREAFGRVAGEPLPDVSDVPSDAFAYYTPPGTYFDLFPIHVLTTGALEAMSRLNPNARWDVRRFRPNIVVDTGTGAADQVEAGWVGRTVMIGRFSIKGELPTVRCAMPTHAQATLPRDPSVLRTIVRDAAQCLGLYASVQEPGSAALGDQVSVVP
jgi:uncharacterized protein YcbX